METPFTLAGLPLQTPDLLQEIRLEESAKRDEILLIEKATADYVKSMPSIIAALEAAAGCEPGAGFTDYDAALRAAATAVKIVAKNTLTDIEITEKIELPAALAATRQKDIELIQEEFDKWLYTTRPSRTEQVIARAQIRLEMRAAGIIEAGPGAAPVGSSVAASSPVRPAPVVPTATPPDAPAPSKLSLRRVALLHVYEGKVIPPAADGIAQHYGHTSGAKLYGHYRTISQRAGRTGEEITGQKLRPMIADMSAVILHLTGPARQQAERELQTLLARKEEK